MADDWTWRDTVSEWVCDTLLDKILLEGIWGRVGAGELIAAIVIAYAYMKGPPQLLY
jgi:hypothetical protein